MQEILDEIANVVGRSILSTTGRIGRMVNGVPCDVKEMDDRYELSANLAGYSKEEVHVTMEKDVLTISAEHADENKEESGQGVYLLRESLTKTSRSFSLQNAAEDGVRAKMENGILRVTVMKEKPEEPPKPKTKTVPVE